jgi:hypothetical protein
MPYQVKTGSLTIVTSTSAAALKLFDEWKRTEDGEVFIRDMEGRTIDPEALRSVIADD